MGWVRHHAIIVTGTYGDWIERAHAKALETFDGRMVSHIVNGVTNDVRSFFVGPDGSKEGWEDSDTTDEKRAVFVEWLRKYAYEDDSSPLAWVEVQYGDEMLRTRIVNHSQQERERLRRVES